MKLLKRTVKSYLIYSLLILLLAIPLSYFIIQALCIQDVDEALQDRKAHLVAQLKTHAEILDQLPWHDLNNEIVIYPPVTEVVVEKKITLPRYSTLNGEDAPFRELHTFLTMNGLFYPVILRISLIDIEDLIQGIVLTEVLLMIAILVGLLWITRQQSKKIWFPFYQALDQLRHFSLDKNPDLHFIPTNIDEFKDMQQEITQLTARTYQTYLQQKEFTENAAHEMQTPLATFQAKLELLMQDDVLTKEQSSHIQSLSNSIARMSKLNKALLLLAKIENSQFHETEEIQLVPVIKQLLDQLEMQIAIRQLTISASYEEVVVRSNPVLMSILLLNLLVNAIHHSPAGGCVTIDVSSDHLKISNAGAALPFPEEKLFHRFQKGDSSEGAAGNGLGLAIVKQICDTCHFTIEHQFYNNRHSFMLKFGD